MKKKLPQKNVLIYQAKNGAIALRGDFKRDTVWATLDQISNVFGRDKSVVSRHLSNIYREKELDKKATVAKKATVQIEGKRTIKREIEYYNLDAIISVGYRINSKTATEFRKWATKTLRGYIVDGYAVNKKVIAKNYAQFSSVMENIKKLLPETSQMTPKDALELVSLFADTWLSLDAYDRELFPKGKLTKREINITAESIEKDLKEFKKLLIQRGEATEFFGAERQSGSVSGIVGNVMQLFNGQELYPTVEEKATHLLYFMVKNHPFTDGNKRSAAFAFIWFLKQAEILDIKKLTPQALTALTILVAESNPNHKDKITKLILDLISK